VVESVFYKLGLFLMSVGFLTPAMCLSTDPPADAMAAYDYVQDIRKEAEKISGTGASQADLSDAVTRLQGALAYLQRKDVRELGTGTSYLYTRRADVMRDLAAVYARLGERDKALSSLETTLAASWFPSAGEWLQQEEAFANLRDDPRFQHIVSVQSIPERLFGKAAFATSYSDELSVEERVAGLSLFWATVRQSFVHFDHVPELDWNKVYFEYLAKIMATRSTREYYLAMMQLAPVLRDAHTNIYPPKELRRHFYARPPMATDIYDDAVLIEAIYSRALSKQLHVGDEIVAIDGVPVKRFAEDRVAPMVSSSTPQDRLVRMYGYQLLQGDADTAVTLQVRNAAGIERREVVARSGYTDGIDEPEFQFRMLAHNVAYIALDDFESEAGVKAFVAALPKILKARGLVIDVRNNGGGSSAYGDTILTYLSRNPIRPIQSYQRSDSAVELAQAGATIRFTPVVDSESPFIQEHQEVFAGPVAVLIGPKTFSAAEDFVSAFQSMKRGITVGERTGGSTGEPLMFDLPGGGYARVCVKRDLSPDGEEFVGVGIKPTFEAHRGVADVRSGRDPALDLAVAKLLTKPQS
jgi:carboxyl-terminal processing protease